MTRPTLFAEKISAVGWSKIPEGGGSDFLLSLVEVGLTDLPKSGRGRAPPSLFLTLRKGPSIEDDGNFS